MRRTANTVAPRLALLVLVVNLAALAGHNLVIVADASTGTAARAVGWAAIVAIVGLQLYHSLPAQAGSRPRGWRLTLAAQVLLLVTLVAATAGDRDTSATGMAAFPAGSALLLLAGWRAWLGFVVLATSVGVHWVLLYPEDLLIMVYLSGMAAAIGLAVYGLSRLADLAEELEVTRRVLARAAVDRERLRVAQDTHDLLGLGLSAVALKCDLAGRLIGRDNARARAELDALVLLAAQAGAEIRAVTVGERGPSLRAELTAAPEVLASAGVEVEVDVEPSSGPLPEDVDTVVATVLREAVTNVLRHATATSCVIKLTTAENAVHLQIANDGVTGEPPDPAPGRTPARRTGGHGLANLAARAAALGGRLTTHTEGGRFELTVQVPLPARTQPEDTLAAGDRSAGPAGTQPRSVDLAAGGPPGRNSGIGRNI